MESFPGLYKTGRTPAGPGFVRPWVAPALQSLGFNARLSSPEASCSPRISPTGRCPLGGQADLHADLGQPCGLEVRSSDAPLVGMGGD